MRTAKVKIQYQKIPQWLQKEIKKKYKRNHTPVSMLLNDVANTGFWLDHWGTIGKINDVESIFISEPYGLTSYAIQNLEKFCNEFNCVYSINSDADWNDGCCRISIRSNLIKENKK